MSEENGGKFAACPFCGQAIVGAETNEEAMYDCGCEQARKAVGRIRVLEEAEETIPAIICRGREREQKDESVIAFLKEAVALVYDSQIAGVGLVLFNSGAKIKIAEKKGNIEIERSDTLTQKEAVKGW